MKYLTVKLEENDFFFEFNLVIWLGVIVVFPGTAVINADTAVTNAETTIIQEEREREREM